MFAVFLHPLILTGNIFCLIRLWSVQCKLGLHSSSIETIDLPYLKYMAKRNSRSTEVLEQVS